MALGASVRAMNAGLACPDWPLCFGQFIPDYHPQVYFEFIHRVVAGLLGLLTLGLAFFLFRRADVARGVKWMVGASLVLYLAQAVMGGLTVLLQLHEKVVAAHLMMATVFLALNLLVYLRLKETKVVGVVSSGVARLAWAVTAIIFGQIFLGGLVASHYAALVCTDFPKCHGQWIPTLSGIVGLHVIHRFGAYFTALSVLVLWIVLRRSAAPPPFRRIGGAMVGMVFMQIGVGIANVVFYTPPLITVIHQAVGIALFAHALKLSFWVRHSAWTKSAAEPVLPLPAQQFS